jgi:hypothetical protein
MNLLIQLQLSNYDKKGRWILECDSGYQMCIGRVRHLLKLKPDIVIDILGPKRDTLITQPESISPDIFTNVNVNWIEIDLIPNAVITRFDFDFDNIAASIKNLNKYDVVLINDPMLLRHYKALFALKSKVKPRFVVHSHFIDNPECPKFPDDTSLWMGQLEAAYKADFNFWQCESSMNIFFQSASKWLDKSKLDVIKAKSLPWDDGYSKSEITSSYNIANVRFNINKLKELRKNSVVIFVPNRVGGKGRSSDYTNCGKFLFDLLPRIRKRYSGNLTIIAGNPSQKFSNDELETECNTLNLVPDTFNRDELKVIMQHSHIVVALYNQDTYGGTAVREAIELGCVPMWLNMNEYAKLSKKSNFKLLIKKNFSNIVPMSLRLFKAVKGDNKSFQKCMTKLRLINRKQCSYESTTRTVMKHLFGRKK